MEQHPAEEGEEAYRPRANDHLVEPFYGGLGAEHEAIGAPADRSSAAPAGEERDGRGALARILGWLRPRAGRRPGREGR